MLERLMSLSLLGAAGAAVMLFGTPAAAPPTTPAKATVTVGPPPDQSIGTSHCECSGPQNCVCNACKCLACVKPPKVEPVVVPALLTPKVESPASIPAPVAVKAAPIAAKPAPRYAQPAAKPKSAPRPVVRYVKQWQPTYGRFGRQTGGQWVYVPVQPPRQYQRVQPVYHYRSCANGSCR